MLNAITDYFDIWTSALNVSANGREKISHDQSLYGVKKLRELISELAVRGKLVPQDPNDEPARVLLEKIAKEKRRLIEEGKIRAQRPPHISENIQPYELPGGWEWTRLDAISQINPRNEVDEQLNASFVPMHLISTSYTGSHGQELKTWGEIKNGFTHFADGDIGIAKITPCFENGKAVIFSELENGIGAGTTELLIARPFGLTLDRRYILLFLKSPMFLHTGETKMTGTAGQKRLPRTFFSETSLPLPPLAEQHRIVAKVDEMMGLCDQLEQQQKDAYAIHQIMVETFVANITNSTEQKIVEEAWQRVANKFDNLFTAEDSIDQLKNTILQLAVMGKLVPQDPNDEPAAVLLERVSKEKFDLINAGLIRGYKASPEIREDEKPFALPNSWEWTRIRDIGHDWGQKTPDGDFTYIEVSNIDNVLGLVTCPNILTAAEAPSRARKIVKFGTVIYSTVRPYLKNICVIEQEYSPEPIVSTAFAVFHPFQQMPGKYFAAYFRSQSFVKYVESVQTGIAYPAINDTQFFNALIPVPPFEEQRRIVARVDKLMAICDALIVRLADAQSTQIQLADAVVEQAVI